MEERLRAIPVRKAARFRFASSRLLAFCRAPPRRTDLNPISRRPDQGDFRLRASTEARSMGGVEVVPDQKGLYHHPD
jgi:hypothetical protein